MAYRKFFKFMVLLLGILFANLITMWIDDYVLTYRSQYRSYVFTWIGMLVVVAIYYPLFTHIDKWATKAANKFMNAGKKLAGREFGAFLAFLAALLILFMLYGYEWFGTNVFVSFFKSLGK